MNMPDIGKFTKTVVFQNNTQVAQGAGYADSYSNLLTTKGYLKTNSGGRGLNAFEVTSDVTFELWVRYQSTLETNLSVKMRVVIDSVNYTVSSWEKIEEKRKYYKLIITEKRG